jgi:hypothetical protein
MCKLQLYLHVIGLDVVIEVIALVGVALLLFKFVSYQ